jgi:uncharacterized membrane protein YkoI
MRNIIALLVMLIPAGLAQAQTPAPAAAQVTVKEESPGLLAAAKITPAAATRTAAARVPAGKIQGAEIEKEDGKLIYSFDIAVPHEDGVREVHVDAVTGKVIAEEHESASAEKNEKAKDSEHDAEDRDPDD